MGRTLVRPPGPQPGVPPVVVPAIRAMRVDIKSQTAPEGNGIGDLASREYWSLVDNSRADMKWSAESWTFKATSAKSTIKFTAAAVLEGGTLVPMTAQAYYGIAIDAVAVMGPPPTRVDQFVYRTSFTIANDIDLGTVEIKGRWIGDDAVEDIYINGKSTGIGFNVAQNNTVGDGLTATYWNNIDFTGSSVSRIDPTIDFMWGQNGIPGINTPDSRIAVDTFSARWTGQILAKYSETYTFYTTTDDRVRLWINDQLLIENLVDHPPTVDQGTITLVAGQKYNLRMDYAENTINATARLEWSSASQTRQIVPQSNLFSTAAPTVTGDGASEECSKAYPNQCLHSYLGNWNDFVLTGSSFFKRGINTIDFHHVNRATTQGLRVEWISAKGARRISVENPHPRVDLRVEFETSEYQKSCLTLAANCHIGGPEGGSTSIATWSGYASDAYGSAHIATPDLPISSLVGFWDLGEGVQTTPFYIGKKFVGAIPAGARALVLGFHDFYGWTDNFGSADVNITFDGSVGFTIPVYATQCIYLAYAQPGTVGPTGELVDNGIERLFRPTILELPDSPVVEITAMAATAASASATTHDEYPYLKLRRELFDRHKYTTLTPSAMTWEHNLDANDYFFFLWDGHSLQNVTAEYDAITCTTNGPVVVAIRKSVKTTQQRIINSLTRSMILPRRMY